MISSARVETSVIRLGNVTAGAKTRVVRVKVDPDHLRDFGELPHSTLKWKRLYKQRSALERINSRIADSFFDAQSLSARTTAHGAENLDVDDGDAGGGLFCHRGRTTAKHALAGQSAGRLTSPLGGAFQPSDT